MAPGPLYKIWENGPEVKKKRKERREGKEEIKEREVRERKIVIAHPLFLS